MTTVNGGDQPDGTLPTSGMDQPIPAMSARERELEQELAALRSASAAIAASTAGRDERNSEASAVPDQPHATDSAHPISAATSSDTSRPTDAGPPDASKAAETKMKRRRVIISVVSAVALTAAIALVVILPIDRGDDTTRDTAEATPSARTTDSARTTLSSDPTSAVVAVCEEYCPQMAPFIATPCDSGTPSGCAGQLTSMSLLSLSIIDTLDDVNSDPFAERASTLLGFFRDQGSTFGQNMCFDDSVVNALGLAQTCSLLVVDQQTAFEEAYNVMMSAESGTVPPSTTTTSPSTFTVDCATGPGQTPFPYPSQEAVWASGRAFYSCLANLSAGYAPTPNDLAAVALYQQATPGADTTTALEFMLGLCANAMIAPAAIAQLAPSVAAGAALLCPTAPHINLMNLRGNNDLINSGNHVVGQTIKPGVWQTAPGVRDCYWERTTGGGEILDNAFVTFAPEGVTVTVEASDGAFTAENCGLWTRVG